MLTNKVEHKDHKQLQKVLTIVQSCLIFLLIVLVILMMTYINRLQGTARVINYAGLVRGATQRLVKLEMTENPDNEMILYLDEVLKDLKYGNGTYQLVSLKNSSYQKKLDNLMLYWDSLKDEISLVRNSDYSEENTARLLEMSEIYFGLADETVSAAEVYSDKIARQISIIEICSAVDMFLLICLIIEQSFSSMLVRKRNIVLSQKAYIDTHTGLLNKNMCEELLNRKSIITEPTACLMFDINNLKITNDTYGHSVGDRLIADFAGAIKKVTRDNDFAGRCGGDEFIVILYDVESNTVNEVLARLHAEVEHFNSLGKHIPISYAQGWALSIDYKDCTYRTLFDNADRRMYENKHLIKEG